MSELQQAVAQLTAQVAEMKVGNERADGTQMPPPLPPPPLPPPPLPPPPQSTVRAETAWEKMRRREAEREAEKK